MHFAPIFKFVLLYSWRETFAQKRKTLNELLHVARASPGLFSKGRKYSQTFCFVFLLSSFSSQRIFSFKVILANPLRIYTHWLRCFIFKSNTPRKYNRLWIASSSRVCCKENTLAATAEAAVPKLLKKALYKRLYSSSLQKSALLQHTCADFLIMCVCVFCARDKRSMEWWNFFFFTLLKKKVQQLVRLPTASTLHELHIWTFTMAPPKVFYPVGSLAYRVTNLHPLNVNSFLRGV